MDIVERLRAEVQSPLPTYQAEEMHSAICEQAANEIERLRERCAAYKDQVKWGSEEIDRLRELLGVRPLEQKQ